jgi:hypothetical protein
MSFEQRLYDTYKKGAMIADMGGYGLSGGMEMSSQGLSPNTTDNYEMMIKNAVGSHAYGNGLSGGRKRKPRKARKSMMGMGPSGGSFRMSEKNPYGPGGMYPHSFPTPGFFPGNLSELKHNMSMGMGPSGGGLSGGRRRMKNPAKVQAGIESASKNSWLMKVKKYRQEHPGVSQKQAFVALKGT